MKYFRQEHNNNRRHDFYYSVILGDFNSIVDGNLDRQETLDFIKA